MAPPTKASKAAKPSVKAGKLPNGAAADVRAKRDADFTKTIVARRNKGDKYGEIASDLNITVGKAIYLFECANQEPIAWTNENDLAKKIVAARKENQSWGIISARVSLPEGKVRKIWSDTTGQDARGQRIGKGGRTLNGAPKAAKPKVAAKPKATPKVASAKAAPAAEETAKAGVKRGTIKRTVKPRVAAS